MSIVLAHIEPINKRYSKQWLNSIEPLCKDVLGSKETQEIYQGEFLDVIGTNKFKLSQGVEIIDYIQEGRLTENDTLLFMDLWNPVACNVAYIRDCLGMKFKIAGMLHAGTWDENDFLHQKNLQKWSKGLEQSMIESADIVLVATNYHKKLIEKYFNKTFNHIVVEKFPVFIDGHQSNPKEDIVVFPHRLAEEKQPHLFSEIKAKYEKKYNTLLEWVRTIDVCKNKTEYYELLSKAKISLSFALQETFGIAMLESQNLGCVPLVPNRLSYKETIHSDYLYNTLDELVDKIYYYINNYKQPEPYKVNDFNNVIGRLA